MQSTVGEDTRINESFHTAWRAFCRNYLSILDAAESQVISAVKAKELLQLHYAPIKEHPRFKPEHPVNTTMIDSLERTLLIEGTEITLLESVDEVCANPEMPVDHKLIGENYRRKLRLELAAKEERKRERRKSNLAAAGSFLLAAVGGYCVQEGYIGGKIMSIAVLGPPSVALLAHGVNKLCPKIKETTRKYI